MKIALNKLKPEELFKYKNKFDAAGIQFEGKALETYENLKDKNNNAIQQVANEALKRIDNIYKEDNKPKSCQTEI